LSGYIQHKGGFTPQICKGDFDVVCLGIGLGDPEDLRLWLCGPLRWGIVQRLDPLKEKRLLMRCVFLSCTFEKRLFFTIKRFQRNGSQSIAPSLDILLNLPGCIDHLGCVENGIAADHCGEFGVGSAFIR
jgi:hypothetical protein